MHIRFIISFQINGELWFVIRDFSFLYRQMHHYVKSSLSIGGIIYVLLRGRTHIHDALHKPVAIVKYKFTNNDNDPTSFMFAFDDNVYQNGVGLNTAIFLDDSAEYNSKNQTKEIKKGATIDVEVAYTLNDSTTDIEVEVKELISFSDKKITKTFKIK